MSADPISRPEFDLFLKMNAESNKVTSDAVAKIQIQGQETLDVLREYTIHNNHKHDETNKRIVDLAKKQSEIKEAVDANTKISSFWYTVKKYALYFVVAALTAFGGLWANDYWKKTHPIEVVS